MKICGKAHPKVKYFIICMLIYVGVITGRKKMELYLEGDRPAGSEIGNLSKAFNHPKESNFSIVNKKVSQKLWDFVALDEITGVLKLRRKIKPKELCGKDVVKTVSCRFKFVVKHGQQKLEVGLNVIVVYDAGDLALPSSFTWTSDDEIGFVTILNESIHVNLTERFNQTYTVNLPMFKGSNAAFYKLESSYTGKFELVWGPDSKQLILRENGWLDREEQSLYNMSIIGENSIDALLIPLIVHVNDVNDNKPEFRLKKINVKLFSNATVDKEIVKSEATDKDAGENGKVEYSLHEESGRYPDIFKIDKETGSLSATHKLIDANHKQVYKVRLTVIAKDRGSPSLENNCTIDVSIFNVNRHLPKICFSKDSCQKSSVTLVEQSKSTKTIIQMFVFDIDREQKVTCEIVEKVHKEIFRLISRENLALKKDMKERNVSIIYDLIAKGEVDREETNAIDLRIHCKDNGYPQLTDEKTLRINIADINDNKPIFTRIPYNFEVNENASIGTVIGKVKAFDRDYGLNGKIFYSMDKFHKQFFIDKYSGKIIVKAPLDYEEVQGYNFTVRANDEGMPSLSSTQKVSVTVININDTPPTIHNGNVVTLSHMDLEESIYTLNATDIDGYAIRYKIIKRCSYPYERADDTSCDVNWIHREIKCFSLNKNDSMFDINEKGKITALMMFDREEFQRHDLFIEVSDIGTPSQTSTTSVEVIVEDQDDSVPEFVHPISGNLTLNISSNIGAGQYIAFLKAIDNDCGKNAELVYRSVFPNHLLLLKNYIQLEATSGNIKLLSKMEDILNTMRNVLNINAKEHHIYFYVEASSGNGKKAVAYVSIWIKDDQWYESSMDLTENHLKEDVTSTPLTSLSILTDVRTIMLMVLIPILSLIILGLFAIILFRRNQPKLTQLYYETRSSRGTEDQINLSAMDTPPGSRAQEPFVLPSRVCDCNCHRMSRPRITPH